jgi:hypothetical protein
MYRIMDRDCRLSLTVAAVLEGDPVDMGPDQPLGWIANDRDRCFWIAADQNALAERLLSCAEVHFALANIAMTSVGALREAARALTLMEKAGNAKQFAIRMLDAAIVFERAILPLAELSPDEQADITGAASVTWNKLMADGILSYPQGY